MRSCLRFFVVGSKPRGSGGVNGDITEAVAPLATNGIIEHTPPRSALARRITRPEANKQTNQSASQLAADSLSDPPADARNVKLTNVDMAHWSTFEKETERETKKLVRCVSGVEDEDDQNFQLALKFAWSNFR